MMNLLNLKKLLKINKEMLVMNFCPKLECGSKLETVTAIVEGVRFSFDKCQKCGYVDNDSKKIGD